LWRRLEGWNGVVDEHLEVCLVPGSGFWGRLESISLSAERIVTSSRAIASTIRLSTGLDPNERIDQGGTSSGARFYSKLVIFV